MNEIAAAWVDKIREEGRQEVLDVVRATLPASDVDAIESRLRRGAVSAGGALPVSSFSPLRVVGRGSRSTAAEAEQAG